MVQRDGVCAFEEKFMQMLKVVKGGSGDLTGQFAPFFCDDQTKES